MFRIDNSTARPAQDPIGAPGTPGFFTDGNRAAGLLATVVDGWWLNTIQEEILYCVTQAGLTPNKADQHQLYQAIMLLIPPPPAMPFLPLVGGTLSGPGNLVVGGALQVNGVASFPLQLGTAASAVSISGHLGVHQGLGVEGGDIIVPQGMVSASGELRAAVQSVRLGDSGQYLYLIWGADGTHMDYLMGATRYWNVSGTMLIQLNTQNGLFLHTPAASKPGGGEWGDNSDARIKTVEGDYTSGLAQIEKLKPVRYRFKGNDTLTDQAIELPPLDPTDKTPRQVLKPASPHSDTQRVYVGLVAQDCEAAMPEMVTKIEGYIDGKHVDDMRRLDTSALPFALLNAVKELAGGAKALAARVTKLEAR